MRTFKKQSMTPSEIRYWFESRKIDENYMLNGSAGIPSRKTLIKNMSSVLCLVPVVCQTVKEFLDSLMQLPASEQMVSIYLITDFDHEKLCNINEALLESWLNSKAIDFDLVGVKPCIESLLKLDNLVFRVPRTFFRKQSLQGQLRYLNTLYNTLAFNHYTTNESGYIQVINTYNLELFGEKEPNKISVPSLLDGFDL